jgi:pimeloyl-ACP methyl ester carboxylesterase
MKRLFILALSLGFISMIATSTAQNVSVRVDAAFQKFFSASSSQEAARTVEDVLESGVTFEDAFARLRTGRRYAAQQAGIFRLMNQTSDGVEHYYAVNVPETYDPSHKYQVRFQLHGGVDGRTDNQPRGSGGIGQLAGAEQIYVLPYSWRDAPWWSDDQILNLNAIVDQLKRTYNIDENRVVVSGVSDGGTGAYYVAMRETTPFASFLPLNGFILVLANDSIDDGKNYPNNLRNKPLFVINGGRDRLYPTSIVEPFTRHLMSAGVMIEYHPQPEGEHNTAWWPQEKEGFEKFVTEHPRDPYPDTLTWTAADREHNRAHWLVIDEFTHGVASNVLPDVNQASRGVRLFENTKPAGRVDLSRKGNTIEATTQDVSSFTILLSPDRFDFSKPVKVVVNGRTTFEGRVEKSVETLMKWAAQDNDRTMLFAAEIKIRVP